MIRFVLHGAEVLPDPGAIYPGDSDFSLALPAWLALVRAVALPLLNPLVEELQYRGYARLRLIGASGSIWLGILVTAAGFGLQHMVSALTPSAVLVLATGFFLWGLGAGLIFHPQSRLVPLPAAHFISNLSVGRG